MSSAKLVCSHAMAPGQLAAQPTSGGTRGHAPGKARKRDTQKLVTHHAKQAGPQWSTHRHEERSSENISAAQAKCLQQAVISVADRCTNGNTHTKQLSRHGKP